MDAGDGAVDPSVATRSRVASVTGLVVSRLDVGVAIDALMEWVVDAGYSRQSTFDLDALVMYMLQSNLSIRGVVDSVDK